MRQDPNKPPGKCSSMFGELDIHLGFIYLFFLTGETIDQLVPLGVAPCGMEGVMWSDGTCSSHP